jgi:phenylalanyl-tRNA synthetase beta chain
MQISLKWIDELVNIETMKLDDFIEKLTLGGFEVEKVVEIEIDYQKQIGIEISATANRSDSLSVQGLSKEIAALFDRPIKKSKYFKEKNKWVQHLSEKTEILKTNSDCSIFVSGIVENVENFDVPNWIKQKLLSSGFVVEHNLSDFQNYILLESGYPFEFYDLDKIYSAVETSDFQLSVRNSLEDQKFLAKNGSNYFLESSVMTVNANNIPISLAGLMQAKAFSLSNTTTKLLIEGSIFNAAKIRQQSRQLSLRTDRSARYEKSLKNTYLLEAFYRLLSLLRISNPNLRWKLHTSQKTLEQPLESIQLRYETIQEILGPTNTSKNTNSKDLSIERINSYLNRLDFQFLYNSAKMSWMVKIPHSRSEDLTREIDLIEEIGRLHGFNNFLTRLPKLKTIGTEDFTYQTRKKITSCLLNLGFNELIHYSLVPPETFGRNDVKIVNPLLSECSSLRSSLLPNLVKTVRENSRQKNLSLEGFEYGHVFSLDHRNKLKEKELIAGIFGGFTKKFAWTDSERPLTWFEAKGKIEQFLTQLNLVTNWQTYSLIDREILFHPYASAELFLTNGEHLGIFGQLHPILANQFNLSPEIYLFEFDLKAIESQLQLNQISFSKSYSLYPKIIKDISLILSRDIKFKEIQEILYLNGTEFLSEINLLDEYKGPSIPADHTSLCVELIFQSDRKTLENKEIETILQNLQSILTYKFNAQMRK